MIQPCKWLNINQKIMEKSLYAVAGTLVLIGAMAFLTKTPAELGIHT
jgi:hypothetical protein